MRAQILNHINLYMSIVIFEKSKHKLTDSNDNQRTVKEHEASERKQ